MFSPLEVAGLRSQMLTTKWDDPRCRVIPIRHMFADIYPSMMHATMTALILGPSIYMYMNMHTVYVYI